MLVDGITVELTMLIMVNGNVFSELADVSNKLDHTFSIQKRGGGRLTLNGISLNACQ